MMEIDIDRREYDWPKRTKDRMSDLAPKPATPEPTPAAPEPGQVPGDVRDVLASIGVTLTYREKLAYLLGDRSKYPGGYYPNEVEKGFGERRTYMSQGTLTTRVKSDEKLLTVRMTKGAPGTKPVLSSFAFDDNPDLDKPSPVPEDMQKRVLGQLDPVDVAAQMTNGINGELLVTWQAIGEHREESTASTLYMLAHRAEDGLLMKRLLTREEDGSLTANHVEFRVPKEAQGHDLAKQVMRETYNTYRELGVDVIKTYANLDVGGYAWAKFGFKADSPELLADELTRSVTIRKDLDLTDVQRTKLLQLISTHRSSPDLPWRIANTVTMDGRKIGKELLLGKSWDATLDMRDSEATARLLAYTKKS